MANLQALDPSAHKGLQVDTSYSSGLGYDQGAVMVMPHEIRAMQREYPLVLRKHPDTGRFFVNALLGFAERENLYLDGAGGWRAKYIPQAFRKGPFMIGLAGEGDKKRAIVSIDLDDARVCKDSSGEERGERLFDNGGQPTPYLQQVNRDLATMHENVPVMHAMAEAFGEAGIVEPVRAKIQLDNGEKIELAGAHAIAEEPLQGLDAARLHKLSERNFLSAAWYIAGSLDNLGQLVRFKNQRNAAGAGAA